MKKELLRKRDRLIKVEDKIWTESNEIEKNTYIFGLDDFLEDRELLYLIFQDPSYLDISIYNKRNNFDLPIEKLVKLISRGYEVGTDLDYSLNYSKSREQEKEQELSKELDKIVGEVLEEMRILQDNYIDLEREQLEEKEWIKYCDYRDFQLEIIEKELNNINMQLEKYENEYLEKMTQIALEKIRKKMKMKKRYFYSCFKNVVVDWDRENQLNWKSLGAYGTNEKLILIDNRYISCYKGNNLTHKNNLKRQKEINKEIIQVLIHELIHHFVKDEFNLNGKIDIHGDASPIFMGILLWINPDEVNGYECFKEFKKTDTYKKMMECKTYDELETLCIHLTIQTERLFKTENEVKYKKIFKAPTPKEYKYQESDLEIEELGNEYLEILRGFKCCNIGIDWINLLNNIYVARSNVNQM